MPRATPLFVSSVVVALWSWGCGSSDAESSRQGSDVTERHGHTPPGACASDEACGAAEYCAFDDGACGGDGICKAFDETCPTLSDPVCGCDGATYENGCRAGQAGVSVAYGGACDAGTT